MADAHCTDKTNFEKMAELGSKLFLGEDQDAILARYPLEHDDRSFFINFLGDRYRIDRESGAVFCGDGPAEPAALLTIMDMVCNKIGAPVMTGKWCNMQELSGACSNPGESSVFTRKVARLNGRAGDLRRACLAAGGREVPGGEVSFRFEVFDGYETWMQFWDADDEFPASLKFLWDRSATLYMHFETLWYVMSAILDRLLRIAGAE